MRQWNMTALLNSITADRIVLCAVLAFQAGLAGWFYSYTRTQSEAQTANENHMSMEHKDIASQADDQLAQNKYSSSVTPSSLRSMRTPSHSAGMGRVIPPHPVALMDEAFITPISYSDQQATADQMRDRMRRRVDAFRQMNNLIYSDDDWTGLAMSPTMDMREQNDHYEVTFSIPDAQQRDIQAEIQNRILTVDISQSQNTSHSHGKQVFTSRILLPENINTDHPVETRFENGNVIMSIPKASPIQ